jgi:dTDP-4-amino-4,6-dideoxygalactose transaminase
MPEALPELDNILHSGSLAYGKWSRQFEQALRSFTSVDNLLVTNTFFSAIEVALSTLGLKAGDEVIASPMSCLQSTMPLLTYGLKVVWADVDPQTGTLDPQSVKEKLSPSIKLIYHNHHCGYPGYVDEICDLGKQLGIPVVDDCIEAFGASYKGRVAGNMGADIAIFSFQTVRLPNTIDGGAIAFRDEKLLKKALLIRDMGVDRAKFRDAEGEISPLCDITAAGYPATMSDVNGYIGCLQMDNLPSLLERQRANAAAWDSWIAENLPDAIPLNNRKDIEPNYWVYGILTDTKHEAMLRMRELGYYASGVHLSNDSYSVFGHQEHLLGAYEFNSKFLALPCGWWM